MIEAVASIGDADSPEMIPPIITAAIDQIRPFASWTKSRSTKDSPAKRTPDGAKMPGHTGIRQGPEGTHVVPTFAISQFDSGTHAMNAIQRNQPSIRRAVDEFGMPALLLMITRRTKMYRRSSDPQ